MKERTFEVRCKERPSGTARAEAESMGKAAAYRERGADWCRLPENGK